MVETHMSYVFLTDRYAFKLKKPVRYDYLDFSTLAARRRDCLEEVRLNQRDVSSRRTATSGPSTFAWRTSR